MSFTKITWMLFCILPRRKWLQTFRSFHDDGGRENKGDRSMIKSSRFVH